MKFSNYTYIVYYLNIVIVILYLNSTLITILGLNDSNKISSRINRCDCIFLSEPIVFTICFLIYKKFIDKILFPTVT